MNANEASQRLLDLIADNGDVAHRAEGCDAATIDAAERTLGFRLPSSFRLLVAELGTWDIAGEEFLGIYRTPAIGDQLLGCVAETMDARDQHNLPSDLAVVRFDGMGGLVVLDSSQPDLQSEYPVLVWNPGSGDRSRMERLGEDFGSYALGVCQRAVKRWRESG